MLDCHFPKKMFAMRCGFYFENIKERVREASEMCPSNQRNVSNINNDCVYFKVCEIKNRVFMLIKLKTF